MFPANQKKRRFVVQGFFLVTIAMQSVLWADLAPGWGESIIAPSGLVPSLAFSSSTGYPSVSYSSGYAQFNGSSWTLNAPPCGFDRSSVAFNPCTGRAGLAMSAGLHTGCYSEFDGVNWLPAESFCGSSECGQYPSLAFDPVTCLATVSRFNSFPPGGDLRFSVRSSANMWTTTVADNDVQRTGAFTSLAYDPSTNRPCIAYQDVTNLDLRFACFDGSTWVKETVDSTGEVASENLLLAFRATPPHNAGISYRDVTNGDLKYAEKSGLAWTITTIDSVGDTGFTTSLAFHPTTGRPTIAYHDATNGALRLAEYNGSSWILSTVDDDAQPYASLAFQPVTNQPAIAYTRGSGQLVYVLRVSTVPALSATGLVISVGAILATGSMLFRRKTATSS